MQRKRLFSIGALVLAVAGIVALAVVFDTSKRARSAVADPRTAPLLVKVAKATSLPGMKRAFTGTVAARVQSNLGFRVPGKIVERLVDAGQRVKAGQPLMRIDETDLRLALTAKRNAVIAARAVTVQARSDEKRYGELIKTAAASSQRYEQAKTALDAAEAQLEAAVADAQVAENSATYSTLVADADGTVVTAPAEPGQVIAAGQTVVQLAHAGPREALIALPETIRPVIGSIADASVYGSNSQRATARLRQISDAADAQTRTYEARYVLEGEAASTPLGATVTIRLADIAKRSDVSVPIGAVLDDGSRTGVWIIDRASSTVRFVPVQIKRLGGETAFVTGVELGQELVVLGAHLLREGANVRTVGQAEASNR
jgi:RND family efflux transporter MFP subunit